MYLCMAVLPKYDAISYIRLHNLLECDGRYGVNCSLHCSVRHCKNDNSPCDSRIGECVGGCKPGWKHLTCTQGKELNPSLEIIVVLHVYRLIYLCLDAFLLNI